jgi:cysteine-rich repeat protein
MRPRSEIYTVLKRLLPALLLPLLLAAPAQAVLIDSGDGTGNTTAPADDPGFAHVGKKGTLSVVYVGYGWVLSAAHVGLGDVLLGGVTYPALSGSRIVLIHSGTTYADLELFRIDPAPPLPPLPIRASEPAVDDPVIMIGNGRNRGDAVSVFPPPTVDDGYYWASSRTMRWGTNVVHSIVPDLTIGSRVTDSFTTSFSRSGTVDECQAANGDSGGAVFIKNAGTWELAGVMHAIGVYAEQVGDLAETSLYGNLTYAADLSQYRTQILDIVTPDCGNGYLTIDEECDDGNTDPGDCCSPTCQYESAATECRASAGACDIAETCTGTSADCPADAYRPSSTECRAAAGVCDLAETCTGVSVECPADAFEPVTTECRAAAGICDAPDYCDGASAACVADAKLTSECRASKHVCDAADYCDGVRDECGFDLPAHGAPCPDGDLCNGDERCVGFVCTAGMPPVCDDGDTCTADSCDAFEGCVFDPIPGMGCERADLPSASPAGRLLLSLLVVGAGATFLARRQRFGA